MPEFDLIIAGGEVVDPDAGLSGRLDVAILDGKIAAIEPSISSGRAGKVIEAGGRLVTPGLVDLHAHVLHGVADLAVPPDEVGVRSGVTTVIDAGSAGAAIFRAFPDWIIPAARTRIVPFMHIAQTGLATSPDISGPSDVSVELTREMLRQHAGLVAGIKVRLVSPAIEVLGLDMLRIAKQLAAEAGIPVMVHIGDILQRGDPGLGREALALLGAGDIVTHVFTPNPGGILDSAGVVFPSSSRLSSAGCCSTPHTAGPISASTWRAGRWVRGFR
ncbi:MAG: amidohydrolase family protein [Galbitalea sp.]